MVVRTFFQNIKFPKSGKGKPVKNSSLPVINILTRTSGRPLGFRKCHESVVKQTYQNIRHIVSYDNPEDLDYLEKYDVEKKRVRKAGRLRKRLLPREKGHAKFEPYNLYCNSLLKEVKDGWIIFLDDDDMLLNENVIQLIVDIINSQDEKTLILWQTLYPDGKVIPETTLVIRSEILYKHIDTACFTFNSKYKKVVKWDAWQGADFRFIKELAELIPKQKWTCQPLTRKNNFGDFGRRNDLTE